MSDEVRVHTDELRRAAAGLADSALRLAHGLSGEPDLLVPAPGWRAAEALAGLEAALHARLGRAGHRAAVTAGALRSAADGYDAVDARVARRLAGAGR